MTDELLARVPPPPRSPSWRAYETALRPEPGSIWFVLGGLVFFLVGCPISAFVLAGVPTDLALSMLGDTTKGTVTTSFADEQYSSDRVTPLCIELTYTVDSHAYSAKSWADPEGALEDRKRDDVVDVDVLRTHPTLARIHGGRAAPYGLGWTSIVIVFPLAGIGIMLVPLVQYARRRSVYVHGTPIVGRIVKVDRDSSVRINKVAVERITWSFEVGGASFTGAMHIPDGSLFERGKPGARVVVLYLPENPARSALYVADA